MAYWVDCIMTYTGDVKVNNLLEKLIEGFGKKYIDDWICTLGNLTNAQLRKVYKVLINSGILEETRA